MGSKLLDSGRLAKVPLHFALRQVRREFQFMKRFLVPLAFFALACGGCSSVEMPGSARYFSNQPGGMPFFKVAAGMGTPTLSVQQPDGKWSRPRMMKPLGANNPPLSTTPGLSAIVESAHRIDDYVFLEFKPDAKVHGQPVPSKFFLLPGGFAYVVPAPK
jgi:hypothetical protein